MERFLANSFLIAAGMMVMLGNMWYTYGIWPQSWVSFFGFGALAIILTAFRITMKD